MADIASNMTVAAWLDAKASPFMDFSTEFIYATMVARDVTDDSEILSEITERQKDLMLADMYFAAAVSSTKSGTQGESDGGWTHYVAIKNVVSREALMQMARDLYTKWGEPFADPNPKMVMRKLYR